MSSEFICLSYFLDDQTPLYGGSKGINIQPERSISKGDTANTKKIIFNNHSGTHIDFPNHFIHDGLTSEFYDANFWVFSNPYVINKFVEPNQIISFSNEEIDNIPIDTDFLIIKTGFGKFRGEDIYWERNPGFAPEVANILRNKFKNLRVLGMDIISLTSFNNRPLGREAHKAFLGSDSPILLVEDMNLGELKFQPKLIVCLPTLIKGVDGAPVNIIASF